MVDIVEPPPGTPAPPTANANKSIPAPHPFTLRLAIGLVGVLLASLSSGLNDRVTDVALPDVRGVLGIGSDEGTWISSVYEAGEVSGMMVAAWFAVTFSFRRFAMGVALTFAALALVFPFIHEFTLLVTLRACQGFVGGLLPPLLMTAALRFLPPKVKLYGLGAYALTATFGPNLAISLAALWTDTVAWQMVYWQVIPPCLLAACLIAYGIPQDPIKLDRFKQFDWVGVSAGCTSIAMLIIGLEQGERLDWINSQLIVYLLTGSSVLLVIFLINEWYHPLPLFKLQLLGRRNFSHGLFTLSGLMILAMAGTALPSVYLGEIKGYRPLEIGPLSLAIAIPQLVLAPLAAAICNIRQIDSRWVLASGLTLLTGSCVAGHFVTSDWIRSNFYILQALQALGLPLSVLPVLMGATGAVQPMEGPFASAIFNTTRGLATVIGSVFIDAFLVHREHFHSNALIDHMSHSLSLFSQADKNFNIYGGPLLSDGTLKSHEAIRNFADRITHQAIVLGIADTYYVLIGPAIMLMLALLVLPQRAYPPSSLRPSSK